MIRIDENYTDFRDDTDPNYPGGKAVDAPTPESIEGTPILARLINCINGFRQAVFQKAFGSLEGLSGEPDHANKSDTLDAIETLIANGDAETLAAANAHTDNAQLATNTWLPSVNTISELPTSGLDPNKNYLCKVLNDPIIANNIVWQLVAGETVWKPFGDMTFIPSATATERGGVRVQQGNGLTLTDGDRLQMNAATQQAAGAMSSVDKTKLDGIAEGAQVNPGNATQQAAGLMSAADKQRLDNLTLASWPVGSYYTQYPVVGATTHAPMFPANRTPAQLFGGTWTERFQGEEVFFRTTGGNADTSGTQLGARRGQRWNGSAWASGGVAGIEPDMIRNITGRVENQSPNILGSGAFQVQNNPTTTGSSGSSGSNRLMYLFNSSLVVPTGTVNQPRNRLIRVWERTA